MPQISKRGLIQSGEYRILDKGLCKRFQSHNMMSVSHPTNTYMASIKNMDTRSLILSASETLIESEGVSTLTLKDISEKAHISQGTLYYYYKSKDDLVLDLLERHMEGLRKDFDEWLLRHQKHGLSGERFLEIVLLKGVKLFNKSKVHLYLIYECLSDLSLRKRYLELLAGWESALEEGIKLSFPRIKDPKNYASILMLSLDGLVIRESLDKEHNEIAPTLEYLLRIGENA